MTLRFLIDECLSQLLVEAAVFFGHEAVHVNHRGLASRRDDSLARYCVDTDTTMVTNNGRDFRRLYAGLPVHPGLVVILPSVNRPGQRILFEAVLRHLEAQPDIVNRLLEVDANGVVTVSDWPA